MPELSTEPVTEAQVKESSGLMLEKRALRVVHYANRYRYTKFDAMYGRLAQLVRAWY